MKIDLLELGFSVLMCLSCGAFIGYFGAAFLYSFFGVSI
jgi:hypothetical protein